MRPHELQVTRVKSEAKRVDLLTKFLGPERHDKLLKLLPLSARGKEQYGSFSGEGWGSVLVACGRCDRKQTGSRS